MQQQPTDFAESWIGRVPPQAVDVEIQVLGAMLRDAEAVGIGLGILAAEDFYRPQHRKVFTAIQTLAGRSEVVDLSTVADELERVGDLEKCGGRAYCIDLADSVFTAANVASHAGIVRNKSVLRRLIGESHRTIEHCYNGHEFGDVSGLLADMESRFSRITESSGVDRAERFIGRGDFARTHDALESIRSIGSGWPSLDRKLVEGFLPGLLSIVAARPTIGKSAFRQNLGLNLCLRGLGVLFLNTEPTQRSEQIRLLAIRTGLSYEALLRFPEWRAEDTERTAIVERARLEIDTCLNLSIVCDRSMRLSDVPNWLREARKRGPLDVVFVDLFDRMQDVIELKDAYAKYVGVKYILQRLAQLAERETVHLCVLAQLAPAQKSSTAARQYSRPGPEDLRETKVFEEVADLMLFLHRPGRYDRNLPDNVIEVHIGKQREGESGASHFVTLGFEGPTRRITDIPPDDNATNG